MTGRKESEERERETKKGMRLGEREQSEGSEFVHTHVCGFGEKQTQAGGGGFLGFPPPQPVPLAPSQIPSPSLSGPLCPFKPRKASSKFNINIGPSLSFQHRK